MPDDSRSSKYSYLKTFEYFQNGKQSIDSKNRTLKIPLCDKFLVTCNIDLFAMNERIIVRKIIDERFENDRICESESDFAIAAPLVSKEDSKYRMYVESLAIHK